MKTKNLLPNSWLQKWGCRPMTIQEIKLLKIQDRNDYEYYVCEDWLKFILNFSSPQDLEKDLKDKISVNFEIEVAKKQQASVKKYKKPTIVSNLEKGQRVDTRSTIRSGMARYQSITFEKTIKKITSRKINPFCSYHRRDSANEKMYALLSTQNDAERVFINYVAVGRNSSITKKNAVIWFSDLDFDMFKAKRQNFYPVISHNLAMAYCQFINKTERFCNAYVSFDIDGVENLQSLL